MIGDDDITISPVENLFIDALTEDGRLSIVKYVPTKAKFKDFKAQYRVAETYGMSNTPIFKTTNRSGEEWVLC